MVARICLQFKMGISLGIKKLGQRPDSSPLGIQFIISEEHLSHFYVSFLLAPRKNKRSIRGNSVHCVSSYMMYHDVLTV